MTDQSDIERRQQIARAFLHEALASLKRPTDAPALVLSNAANAIDKVCKATVMWPELATIGADITGALHNAFLDVAAALSSAAEDDILPEDIHSGLGSTLALLATGRDEFQRDRLDYACILYGQLRVAFHRRDLRVRGFPLAQAIQMKRLMETPRLPTDPIN